MLRSRTLLSPRAPGPCRFECIALHPQLWPAGRRLLERSHRAETLLAVFEQVDVRRGGHKCALRALLAGRTEPWQRLAGLVGRGRSDPRCRHRNGCRCRRGRSGCRGRDEHQHDTCREHQRNERQPSPASASTALHRENGISPVGIPIHADGGPGPATVAKKAQNRSSRGSPGSVSEGVGPGGDFRRGGGFSIKGRGAGTGPVASAPASIAVSGN